MSKVLILRPEPGAARTATRARARGLEPVLAPLFAIRPLKWAAPAAGDFDAVMLTSANAPRCGGDGLASFARLPCYAVGKASAAAAQAAGFADVRTGPSDGAALVEMMAADGVARAFHPCGREHIALSHPSMSIKHVPVYASEAMAELPEEAVEGIGDGTIVLIHSPRAGALFASLAAEMRARIRIAAISPAAAEAAGMGWKQIAVAPKPRDQALLELAAKLCHRDSGGESSNL